MLDDAGSQHRIHMEHFWQGWRKIPKELKQRLHSPRLVLVPSAAGLILQPIIVAVVVGFVLSQMSYQNPYGRFVLPGAIIVVGVLYYGAVAARARARSAEYIRLMKARALCPACIYSLEGVNVPSDGGLTACPECGSKWLMGFPTGA